MTLRTHQNKAVEIRFKSSIACDEPFRNLLMATQHSLELSNALIESVLDGMEAKAASK